MTAVVLIVALSLATGLAAATVTVLWQLHRERVESDAWWDAVTEDTIVRILSEADQ